MWTSHLRVNGVVVLATVALLGTSGSAAGAESRHDGRILRAGVDQVVSDSFIVVLKPGGPPVAGLAATLARLHQGTTGRCTRTRYVGSSSSAPRTPPGGWPPTRQ